MSRHVFLCVDQYSVSCYEIVDTNEYTIVWPGYAEYCVVIPKTESAEERLWDLYGGVVIRVHDVEAFIEAVSNLPANMYDVYDFVWFARKLGADITDEEAEYLDIEEIAEILVEKLREHGVHIGGYAVHTPCYTGEKDCEYYSDLAEAEKIAKIARPGWRVVAIGEWDEGSILYLAVKNPEKVKELVARAMYSDRNMNLATV